MRSKTKLPAIPDITGVDEQTRIILEPIKEITEVQTGRRGNDHLDTTVTWRDLVNAGLISESDVPRK